MAGLATRLRTAAEVLKRLGRVLGGDPDDVIDRPAAGEIHLRWTGVRAAALAGIGETVLSSLEAFGSAATLGLEYRGDEVWSSRDFSSNADAAVGLRGEIQRFSGVVLDANLWIDRQSLARHLDGEELPEHVRLEPLYRAASVTALLPALRLTEPESWQQLGADFDRFTLFVCLTESQGLATVLLEICDERGAEKALARAAKAAPEVDQARRIFAGRRNHGPLPELRGVVPQHFAVREPETGTGAAPPGAVPARTAAEADCDRIAAELALAYLAKRTETDPQVHRPFLVVDGLKTVEIEPDPGLTVLPESAERLCALVRWACDEHIDDKLEIARNVLSLQLGGDRKTTYAQALEGAERVFGSAKSNWKVYLRQATKLYFEKQKELSDYAAAKVAQYGQRLMSLLKGLSGYGITLLGFFLTKLLLEAGKTDAATLRMAGWGFFVYSVVMLGALFTHALVEEKILTAEIASDRERLGQLFGDEELRETFEETIERRRVQFRRFLGALLGLAGAALGALLVLLLC